MSELPGWEPTDTGIAGNFRVLAYPGGSELVDITTVRGVPTKIGKVAFSDPGGPRELELTFPAVTILDRKGSRDLSWLNREVDVELRWDGDLPPDYPWAGWRWVGWMESFRRGFGKEASTTVLCKGAILEYDLDNAWPEYPARPMTYESAISRRFGMRPGSRVAPLRVFFPSWWTKTYATKKNTPAYMIPTGVAEGQPWTGMVTRDTGSWSPVWSTYISGLLSAMYTARGRWTIDMGWTNPDTGEQLPARTPALFHRDMPSAPPPHTIVINPVDVGVEGDLSEDWSQTGNEYYGQGTSLSGVAYAGMEVDNIGKVIGYKPLDAARQVWPARDKNGWWQPHKMRRQVNLQLPAGLTRAEAAAIAAFQRRQFTSPGLTGSISLHTDPRMLNGARIPRHLIRAGMHALVLGAEGNPSGVLCHIVDSDANPETGDVSLTVDSKFRDRLTVREVQLRGRDALSVTRMLVGGQYQPPVPDQLYPWDYGAGSGIIPSGKDFSAVRLFKGMPRSITFPWTEWTTQRPPKAAAWKSSYIRIGPKNANADKNWSGRGRLRRGFPVRMAQAGTIMLVQVAAYDRDGHVMAVPFHVSFWLSSGANFASTPTVPPGGAAGYPSDQHYPFFLGAWEQFKPDGTKWRTTNQTPEITAGYVRGWGSGPEKAGYYPGDPVTPGATPTGLLVDEATWSFDLTTFDKSFDPYVPTGNLSNPLSGHLYALIYCDAQASEEVFFLGRCYRQPPGSAST